MGDSQDPIGNEKNMNLKDAHQIRDTVNSGEITAKDWANAALDRIEAVDPDLGVFLTVEPSRPRHKGKKSAPCRSPHSHQGQYLYAASSDDLRI